MTKNMGSADRIIRTIVAVVLAALVITGNITGLWAVLLGFFAVILILTSAIGWCPAYKPFGFSTRRPK